MTLSGAVMPCLNSSFCFEMCDGGCMPKRYRTICVDPPWPSPFGKLGVTHRANPCAHYPTVNLDWIRALPVEAMSEARAHLYLWVLNSNVPDGWAVARAWGFRPLTMVTWCKTQPGVGKWFRTNTEHVLFCTKGKPLPRAEVPIATWFRWPRGRHSEKPGAFYDLVGRVSPGPYLELFARTQRLGWDSWGNEALNHVSLSLALPDAPRSP